MKKLRYCSLLVCSASRRSPPTALSRCSTARIWTDGMAIRAVERAGRHDRRIHRRPPLEYNNFLSTKKTYANFILRTQVKLRNHNSGIQFRSETFRA